MIIVVGKECMGARFSFNQGYTSQHCVEYIHWIRKTRRMISSLKPMCSVHFHGVERVLFGGLCRERPLIGYEGGLLELRVKDNNWIPVFHENFIDHEKEQIRKYCVTNDAVMICGGGAGPYFFGLGAFLVDFLTNGFPAFVCRGLLGADGAWKRRGVP